MLAVPPRGADRRGDGRATLIAPCIGAFRAVYRIREHRRVSEQEPPATRKGAPRVLRRPEALWRHGRKWKNITVFDKVKKIEPSIMRGGLRLDCADPAARDRQNASEWSLSSRLHRLTTRCARSACQRALVGFRQRPTTVSHALLSIPLPSVGVAFRRSR